MPELVTIPLSFFELTVEYASPDVRLLGDRGTIVQAILEAFKPWGPNLDEMELRNTGKPSEQGVNFKLPLKRVFFSGLSIAGSHETMQIGKRQRKRSALLKQACRP